VDDLIRVTGHVDVHEKISKNDENIITAEVSTVSILPPGNQAPLFPTYNYLKALSMR
jgi:hypothetical protein